MGAVTVVVAVNGVPVPFSPLYQPPNSYPVLEGGAGKLPTEVAGLATDFTDQGVPEESPELKVTENPYGFQKAYTVMSEFISVFVVRLGARAVSLRKPAVKNVSRFYRSYAEVYPVWWRDWKRSWSKGLPVQRHRRH